MPVKLLVQCGAASVTPRKKVQFIRVQGLASARKWLRTYFYVKNNTDVDFINLPAYVAGTSDARLNWRWCPSDRTKDDVEITACITELVPL